MLIQQKLEKAGYKFFMEKIPIFRKNELNKLKREINSLNLYRIKMKYNIFLFIFVLLNIY
jgi:hypothetical protein